MIGQEILQPGTRIFLRQDSVFFESEGGVFLRGGTGEFFVRGGSAYGWLSRLAPALAAGTTLGELCDGLDEARARTIGDLVRTLADKGFVRTLAAEPDDLLSVAEQDRFAAQVSFLAHHSDRPHAAFRQVRDARVIVVGGEAGALAAARTLLRNGVAQLALLGPVSADPGCADTLLGESTALAAAGVPVRIDLLPTDWRSGWQESAAAWQPSAIIATPEGVPGALVGELAELAHRVGAAFLPARGYADLILKGPLTVPRTSADRRPAAGTPAQDTACWHCLRLQLVDNAPDELAVRILRDESMTALRSRGRFHGVSRESPDSLSADCFRSPLLAAATGSELATEFFKFASGALDSDIRGAVVVQSTNTLETRRELLPRRADCPACGLPTSEGTGAAGQERPRLKAFRDGHTDLADGLDDRMSRYRAVLARVTGLLREFDDDDLPQIPLRSGRVLTAGPAGYRACGFSTSTSADARAEAVERSLRHAAAHAPAPLAVVRRASAAQLRAEGAVVAMAGRPGHPEATAFTGLGGRTGLGEPVRAWTPALRLLDDAVVWAPLEPPAADGPTPLAGFGAGATARDVVSTALGSALLAERLRDWLDGMATPRPIDVADDIDELHLPLVLGLQRGGVLRVVELPDPAAVAAEDSVAHVVLARYEPGDGRADGLPLQVAAVGSTPRAAVAEALRELAGRAGQSDPDGYPDGPYTVLCPPHWPALRTDDHSPPAPPERRRHADAAPSGPPPADAGPTAARRGVDPDRVTALLAARGRDVLLLELAPSGLGAAPDGTAVVLAGQVLITTAPTPSPLSS